MSQTVEVTFKGTRRGYYFAPERRAEPLRVGEVGAWWRPSGAAISAGVTAVGEVADKKCGGCSSCASRPCAEPAADAPRRAVLRRATPEELRTLSEVRTRRTTPAAR